MIQAKRYTPLPSVVFSVSFFKTFIKSSRYKTSPFHPSHLLLFYRLFSSLPSSTYVSSLPLYFPLAFIWPYFFPSFSFLFFLSFFPFAFSFPLVFFRSSFLTLTSTFPFRCCLNLQHDLLLSFFQTTLSLIMLIPEAASFSTLIGFFSFAAWLFYGSTFTALLWLRWKKPEMHRPFKVCRDSVLLVSLRI